MTDTPASLLRDMQDYMRTQEDDSDEALHRTFGERSRALDEHELLVYLFRNLADSRLSVWLRLLAFAWKDVSYGAWLRVLEDLADDRRHVHQFLWFASEQLALDIHRLGVPYPNVQTELEGVMFGDGGPHPISPELRARTEDAFDYESVWRRLAREGAPMRELPPGSPDLHGVTL